MALLSAPTFDRRLGAPRPGAETRLALTLVGAALAVTFSNPVVILAWASAVVAWELVAAPAAQRRLLAVRRAHHAEALRAALAAAGACLYGVFPFLVYADGAGAGVVMAVAWIGGAGIQIFIQFSRRPRLLVISLLPSLAAACAVPWLLWGASLLSGVVAVTALCLMVTAGLFLTERDRRAAARESENVARVRSRILATMTHELHAPLQTIVSQSDALARELGDANAAAAARHIKDASAELLALVRRADEVSRLAEGEVGSERRDVEIDAFLSDIAAALAPAAERSNNTLQIAIWSEIGVFPIDAENARRCLLCVCENAIEFTRGGVIQLGARRRGDWLEFTIEDTGARLSRDTQAQLHALLRGDVGDAGAHEALGLGLALSAGLARLMRAEISVSGADGRGALFTLRLPLAD